MNRAFFQTVIHLTGQFVALDFFFPDGKQPHARPPAAKGHAVVDLSHHGKLLEVLRLRIDIRAHIQQHAHSALGVRKGRRQRHAIHRRQRAQGKPRHGHHRAGVPGADHAVGLAVAHQPRGYVHRAVFLSPKRLRGVIFHRDHLVGRNDFDVRVRVRMLGQFRTERRRLPHQQNAHAKLPRGQNAAFDLGAGRMVSAHRVHCDCNHGDFDPELLACPAFRG